MTDKEIVALFLDRNQQALAETKQAYGSQCMRLARRILDNADDAEECVNDSYLRLWQRIPPDRPVSLGAYLSRIVRNVCFDRLRQLGAAKRGGSAITVSLNELEQITGRSSVESELAAKELGAAVGRFLRTVPDLNRTVFLRRYYFMDTREEIAARCSISTAQVSVRLSRTRKQLRDYLKKEGLL